MADDSQCAASAAQLTGFARESSRIGLNLVSLVASRFLSLALSLVQMGIIFRALSVEGAGQFGYALNYPALFSILATLGIQRLLIRDVAREPGVAWTYVWTATGVTAFLSVVVTSLIAGSTLVVAADPMVRYAIVMATMSVVVLYALQRPFEALLMARERMVALAIVNVISAIARVIFTYYALRIAATSAMAHAAIAAGNAIGFILCVGASIYVAGWERPHFRFSLARKQIVGSLPFTIAACLSMVYFKADMSILRWLTNEATTGIYTYAQRIMEPMMMIAGIWGVAVFPALCRFSVQASDHHGRLMKTSARLVLLVAFPMAFGIAILAWPIVALLTGAGPAEVGKTVYVLRLLCIVTPFFYLNSVGQEFLYSTHRNWSVVVAYAVGSIVSVAGNFLLIPKFGVPGVAVTAIAANAVISVIFVAVMRSDYGAMGLIRLVTKTVAACVVMAAIAYALTGFSLAVSVLCAGIAYLALQTLFRTLDREERRLVIAMARAPFAGLAARRARG